MAGAVYVHRSAEDILPTDLLAHRKAALPGDFEIYHVVKYNRRTGAFSFALVPGFDFEPEPVIHAVATVSENGRVRVRRYRDDRPIYHHKWMFVAPEYRGFDVRQSEARSERWTGLPDIDRSRIGWRRYWESTVLPQLDQESE